VESSDAIAFRRGAFGEDDHGNARGEGRAHALAHFRHRARTGAIQEQGADGFSKRPHDGPLRQVILRHEERGTTRRQRDDIEVPDVVPDEEVGPAENIPLDASSHAD
jgi:hypothetical protein